MDATFIGLGSMLGAGVFVSFGPAAKAAGAFLGISLILAAFLAWCNATSSARLASRYPESGGTYIYGTKQLGPLWGFLAGWSFIIGKLASCVAIALTFGHYLYPNNPKVLAVVAVTALTSINYFGVSKSTRVTKWLVSIIVAILVGVTVVILTHPSLPTAHNIPSSWALREISTSQAAGILQGAAFMFFAFAGYARIATLGEEVKSPQIAIPRAISRALLFTLVLYSLIAIALVHHFGTYGLAQTTAALAEATNGVPLAHTLVRCAAITAALGSLLTIILGISRTTFAMARDGNLPKQLAQVHPRYHVPHIAEICVGIVTCLLLLLTDLHFAIGFSAFAVLVYYTIANASAFTLDARASSRILPVAGFIGCLAVALSLPSSTIKLGVTLLGVATLIWSLTHYLSSKSGRG